MKVSEKNSMKFSCKQNFIIFYINSNNILEKGIIFWHVGTRLKDRGGGSVPLSNYRTLRTHTLPANCNLWHAAPMTRSCKNHLLHILTLAFDLSEIMQLMVTCYCQHLGLVYKCTWQIFQQHTFFSQKSQY